MDVADYIKSGLTVLAASGAVGYGTFEYESQGDALQMHQLRIEERASMRKEAEAERLETRQWVEDHCVCTMQLSDLMAGD